MLTCKTFHPVISLKVSQPDSYDISSTNSYIPPETAHLYHGLYVSLYWPRFNATFLSVVSIPTSSSQVSHWDSVGIKRDTKCTGSKCWTLVSSDTETVWL